MIDIFIKGWLIGLAVAAPVGPIGILCIKRSLADGFAIGLATGFGAAVADALYGLLAASGLSLTGLLVAHADKMALLGGMMIVYLGLSTVRRGFSSNKAEMFDGIAQTPENALASRATFRSVSIAWRARLSAFGTTFLLTLANPTTILAFVGILSGLSLETFKATQVDADDAAYWLVFGVLIGSACWWLMLVTIVSAIRGMVSETFMRGIDFVSGGLLSIWGASMVIGAVKVLWAG